jgi:hypothetical protein
LIFSKVVEGFELGNHMYYAKETKKGITSCVQRQSFQKYCPNGNNIFSNSSCTSPGCAT